MLIIKLTKIVLVSKEKELGSGFCICLLTYIKIDIQKSSKVCLTKRDEDVVGQNKPDCGRQKRAFDSFENVTAAITYWLMINEMKEQTHLRMCHHLLLELRIRCFKCLPCVRMFG